MDDGQRRTLPSQLRGPGRLRVCRTATGRPLCAAAGWCRCRHCVPVATTGPATTGSATTGSATTLAPVELVAALPGVTATGVVVESTLVTADGRTRVHRTYVPSALPDGPVPLLLAFHGGTGWGRQFERNSGFDELAESNGILVVYPDGVGSGADETTNRTWNGGECCGAAARNNVDDVAFVSQLLDTLAVEYDIDSTRVFIAGHSNGGILSYRLACELSDRIVAVGLQAGTIGIQNCAPSSPVSLLHIHGEADKNVPIDGGEGPDSLAGVNFTSPRAAVQTFAISNGCSSEPEVAGGAGNADLTISTWAGCEGAQRFNSWPSLAQHTRGWVTCRPTQLCCLPTKAWTPATRSSPSCSPNREPRDDLELPVTA